MHRAGRASSCSHGQDYGGAASDDISSGKYSFARGALRFVAGLNVSALVRVEAGRGALHNRVGTGADRDDGDREWQIEF